MPGGRIELNMEAFTENVGYLRDSINNVDSGIPTNESFEFTNVKPFTEDISDLIETIELLQTYRILFNEDTDTLAETGEALRRQDETLANSNSTNPQGGGNNFVMQME